MQLRQKGREGELMRGEGKEGREGRGRSSAGEKNEGKGGNRREGSGEGKGRAMGWADGKGEMGRRGQKEQEGVSIPLSIPQMIGLYWSLCPYRSGDTPCFCRTISASDSRSDGFPQHSNPIEFIAV